MQKRTFLDSFRLYLLNDPLIFIGKIIKYYNIYKVGVLAADAASTKTLRSNSKGLSQLPSQKQYSEFSINRQ